MSGIRDTATVTLNVNGQRATQVLNNIRADIDKTRKAITDLQKAGGDVEQIEKLKKELRKLENELSGMESATKGVQDALQNLDRATPRELNKAITTLRKQLKDMRPNTAEWDEATEKIQRLQAQLKFLNDDIRGQESSWSKFAGWVNKWQTAILGGIASVAGIVAKARQSVADFADMEEEMANTRKFTGMTEEQVRDLNDEFKKMDTRSSREQLNKLAQEAGRLGKSTKEDVMGYVEAADIINVALDELGDGATQQIAKLTDIFGVEKIYGTRDAMLKVSSVVNDLSQSCTASAPYMVEFAKRMAGVGAQAKMTVPQIMAFGAVLDASAQPVEMSATAISQTIMKLFQKPAEIAKTVGMDVKAFTETLKRDTTDGLMMFLNHLKSIGGDKAIATLSPLFNDLGLDGARMSQVLSVCAGRVDLLRQKMLEANDAFREGTSTQKEFNIFNTTVQASLDKARKNFHELSVELGERLRPLMMHVISSSSALTRMLLTVVKFISEHKTSIIGLIATFTIYKVAIVAHNRLLDLTAAKTLIVTKATTAWNMVTSKLSGVIAVGRVAIAAMTNAVQYLTNGFNVNYTMQQRWRKAMASMSFASWTGLILGLASAIMMVYRHMKKLEEERRVVEKIRDEAIKKLGSERVSIDLLVAAARNEMLSLDERKKAIEKLNALIPDYNGLLDETTGKYTENKDALEEYLKLLVKKYELEGAKSKLAELGQEKAAATVALSEAQKQYDNVKENRAAGKGFTYTTSWGSVGNTMADSMSHFEEALDAAKHALKTIEDKEQSILKAYGIALQKAETTAAKISEAASEITDEEPENDGEPSPIGYQSQKALEKDRRKAELEAKRALAKQNKAYKAAMEKAKADMETDMAQNEFNYAIGSRSYEEYLAEKERLDLKYVSDRIKVYESLYNDESKENKELLLKYDEDYRELLLKQTEATRKQAEERSAISVKKLKQEFDAQKSLLESAFSSPDSPYYQNVPAQEEALFRLKISYLQKYRDSYKMNSRQWAEYEAKLQEEEQNRMMAKRKQMDEFMAKWGNDNHLSTIRTRRDVELAMLEELYRKKKISEEQYLEWLNRIRESYQLQEDAEIDDNHNKVKISGADGKGKTVDTRTSLGKISDRIKDIRTERDQTLKALKTLYETGEISEKEYLQRCASIRKQSSEEIASALKENLDPQTAMLLDLGEAWRSFFKNITELGILSFADLEDVAKSTVQSLCAGLEMYGQFAAAQSRIDIANTAKRYDKEIEAAGDNSEKVKQLEKKKEAEIAALKQEATRKEFNIKVATAIAQTAQNALSAFGAGLAAGFPMALWLAPALAALATATGAVQIALIKKQQQAVEAEGYSEGGFTKPGPKNRPAGIVHAGEWVASQKLLSNPVARPLIEALDYAQRNNTFGSLRSEDVSRTITAPATIARISENDTALTLVAAAVTRNSDMTEKLNNRLNRPFVTVNTVTGDTGIKRAQDEYTRLMRNKSPKIKR